MCKMFGLEPAQQLLGDPIKLDINLACYIAVVEGENQDHQEAKEKKNHENEVLSETVLKELEEYSKNHNSRGG